MLLAGGQGSRLHVLTEATAKPAVPYGGKYRIIDFPLSNCSNSGVDTVGVLTQYKPMELNSYIGNGAPWDLNRNNGGVYVLPPYATGETGQWYLGTANAIGQNIRFIEQFDPTYVLILSGDHIYKMDYSLMLAEHEEKEADATLAVFPVPIEEASRFGVLNTDADNRIESFDEKPKNPKSNKASMGIYIFTWEKLREYLLKDNVDQSTDHDFGKNIIPAMLADGLRLFAYSFRGYWKDVGTIESLWEANMDLLEDPPLFNLYDPSWRIYGKNAIMPPHYIAPHATVTRSIITEGAQIYGSIAHSVIFSDVIVEKGAVVVNSIIMPGVRIQEGARVFCSIVGEGTVIGANAQIGQAHETGVTVFGEHVSVPAGVLIESGTILDSCYSFEKELKG